MTAQLPPQGPREPDEHLPGDAELAALYRQLPRSEPSAALDAAVLRAAAHALTHPKPGATIDSDQPEQARPGSYSGRRRTGSRWLIALSSAATLVLAAGLAWHMREMPSTATTSGTANYRAAVNSPVEVASPAAVAAPSPPAAPAQLVTAQTAGHLAEPVATLPQTPRMATAKTTMKRHHATPSPPVEEVSKAAAPMLMLAPPAPAPPPPVEMSASAVAPAPFPAAPAPAIQAIEKPTAVNPGDTPAQELGKIQQLFAQGHDNEARQRLIAFHHAYPLWELPAELDAQLHKP